MIRYAFQIDPLNNRVRSDVINKIDDSMTPTQFTVFSDIHATEWSLYQRWLDAGGITETPEIPQ